jgi:hypothetical protein
VLTWDPDHRHPHLLTFLEKTMPRVLPAAVAQWRASKPLLLLYAGHLGRKLDDHERQMIYRGFSGTLFPRHEPEEADLDDEPEDYYDEP